MGGSGYLEGAPGMQREEKGAAEFTSQHRQTHYEAVLYGNHRMTDLLKQASVL